MAQKTRASDDADDHKFLITACTLLVRKVIIHPGIEAAHRHLFANKAEAEYPVNRVRTSVHVLTPGSLIKMIHLIVGGQAPEKGVLMLMHYNAMEGDYAQNPKRSDHCKVQEIDKTMDSGSAGNGRWLTMNYEQRQYALSYVTSM